MAKAQNVVANVKKWDRNITGVDQRGTFRSLNGAADENVFIGRASKAGFYCFFKVWRDMPYDAILDYNSILYRVEVKGSSNGKFNVTRGSRSGKQINKAPGMSKTRLLSRDDCDFVVGVDSITGDCFIIPEDIVEIINIQNLSAKSLDVFKEKWKLFMHGTNMLSKEETRDGLRKLTTNELKSIVAKLNIAVPAGNIKVPGTTKGIITGNNEKMIYCIWTEIAKKM